MAKRSLIIFVKIVGAFLFFCNSAFAQMNSNQGYEFWAVFPTHQPDFDENFNILSANISVFITGSQASSGALTCGSFSQQFSVFPNQVTEIQVPRNDAYINDFESGVILQNRAIHVIVDPGKPKIVVYAHIFAGQRSAASLILPREALGQRYFGMAYAQSNGEGKNFITIVATEPNTKVYLKRGQTDLVPGGVQLNNINDVYEYLSDDDLTGVLVTVDATSSGCKSFAMFSGSSGVYIADASCTPKSVDPLYQQGYPVESWGKSYGFVPFSTESVVTNSPVRTLGQYVRVLAKNDNTEVKINEAVVAILNSGEFYTSPQPLKTASHIIASSPVCVAQYALTQSCSNGPDPTNAKSYSDPDMVILNPIEFNINNITVYSSSREDIVEQYINVLIKSTASSSFRVNGIAPTLPFQQIANLPGYVYLQLNLNNFSNKTFTLTASEGFNAVAYGFGNVESYSYSAGTNLFASYAVNAIKTSTNQIIESACANEDYFFKLTLPFSSTKLSWQLDPTEIPDIQTNPIADIVSVNGIVFYEYTFPKTAAYSIEGLHAIKIYAEYPASECSEAGQREINSEFTVIYPPQADFTFTPITCNGDIVKFKNTSIINGEAVKAIEWDFDTDSNDDAKEIFNNPGSDDVYSHTYPPLPPNVTQHTYRVKLRLYIKTECFTEISKEIQITAYPKLKFDAIESVCVTAGAFQLTQAQETSGISGLGVYSGRGVSANGFFDPAVAGTGRHFIQYSFTTSAGCSEVATQTITVLKQPRIALPPLITLEKNKSVLLRPTIEGENLTYLWNPSIGLSSNTIVNPIASPHDNTTYTLTVSNGICSFSATITIDVVTPIKPPNTFTPNRDGINDTWVIDNIEEHPDATVDVFNRYGVNIFHSKGYNIPWDGKYNHSDVPFGTYYYIISFSKNKKQISGSLTIIR